MTALAHLEWPPTAANTAAWIAATSTSAVGDTGADHGPIEEPLTDWDSDRRADADENRRWRNLP